MRNLALEIKLSIKRLRNKVVEVIKVFFAIIGVLMMIAEFADEVFQTSIIFEIYKTYFWIGIVIIFLITVVINWDNLSFKVRIADSSDVTITLKVCDVLKNKGAVIIPTNTTFDTLLENEFISKNSVQGQYQLRYFKDRTKELDKRINDCLNDKEYIILTDKRDTKLKQYPIGTVCKITEKDKRAYFLADSDLNKEGIPINTDVSEIATSLISLWDSLSLIGNQEPYSIPLLGSGKARYKNASREEIIREIILTFISATKNKKITESLIICIHPIDYEKIDWDAMCDFLKYNCTYSNLKPEQIVPSGIAE